MSFQVQTETFEGPFDLLLHLILKDDVDLYEVRLCEIVDAYLAELSQIENCDLEVSTEFLLIAATLVELKCRRLLPVDDDLDLDEELGLWEERDLLLARLFECKTFKDAAVMLQELMDTASLSIPRQFGLEESFLALAPDPLAGMTAAKLRRAFLRLVAEKPRPEELSLIHISAVKADVTDAIETFIAELPGRGPVTFRALTDGIEERIEVVVRFLAVLELFKQGLIELEQAVSFGELVVVWTADEIDLTAGGHQSLAEMTISNADVYEG
ncbi:MAG: segregation/condensation protein A [Acidimicrobiia bacterium]|nr:segregation/condensation protein A [Acidimicrobiia bacterium]